MVKPLPTQVQLAKLRLVGISLLLQHEHEQETPHLASKPTCTWIQEHLKEVIVRFEAFHETASFYLLHFGESIIHLNILSFDKRTCFVTVGLRKDLATWHLQVGTHRYRERITKPFWIHAPHTPNKVPRAPYPPISPCKGSLLEPPTMLL